MGFFGSRERDIEKMVSKHIRLVDEAINIVPEMCELYLKGDERYLERSKKIHDLEHEADKARRDIEIRLHEGAFLAMFREDFINLSEAVDKIAGKAEAVADELALEEPEIPKRYHEDFIQLVKESVRAFKPMSSIDNLLSDDIKLILNVSREVENIEQEVDCHEWKIIKGLFADKKLDLGHKLQLRDLFKRIAAISDRAEDASDRLEILAMKRQV